MAACLPVPSPTRLRHRKRLLRLHQKKLSYDNTLHVFPGIKQALQGKFLGAMVRRPMEPLAKLISGDQRPRFGPFPNWNFGSWHHHAPHFIPKMVSKRDCCSSTQSSASNSKEMNK